MKILPPCSSCALVFNIIIVTPESIFERINERSSLIGTRDLENSLRGGGLMRSKTMELEENRARSGLTGNTAVRKKT